MEGFVTLDEVGDEEDWNFRNPLNRAWHLNLVTKMMMVWLKLVDKIEELDQENEAAFGKWN